MRQARNALLGICCAATAGCATSGAYGRWNELRSDPANRAWGSCIEEQTRLRLSSALDTEPPGPEAVDAAGKTDAVVVADIIAACRPHMSNFGDGILSDKRNKRMLLDAYDYYRMQKVQLQAAEEAAVI